MAPCAKIESNEGACKTSTWQRSFCRRCASGLWLFDPTWPDLIHPWRFGDRQVAPERVHLMLSFKANWVKPRFGRRDKRFQLCPDQSIEDWHKSRGLWAE